MTSTNTEGKVIKFGPFEVTKQVFLVTPHCYGLVNLKPILPGHILICPLKPHLRLADLSTAEVTDLFTTVQLAQKLLANTYFPTKQLTEGSFTVAIQDGVDAGQTVPHLHVHIIPRRKGDMGESIDQVYVEMASEKGNVGGALWDLERERPQPSGKMPRIEDLSREMRTMEDMVAEAEKYKVELRGMGVE